jgi:PleD family two-component response regulator
VPDASEAQAVAIVDAIVAECPDACAGSFPTDGEQQTVSAGVAAYADFPKLPNEALVKLADEALYRAKTAGRNGRAAATGRTY